MTRAPVRGLHALGPWLAGAPALALVAFAWAVAVDAPLPDDVDAILAVANRMAVTQGVGAQAALWLEPHVDHRILTTRSLAALQLAIAGRVDLRVLAFAGVAALLLTAWLLPRLGGAASSGASPADGVFAGAASAWLLLQPQAFDALISPTAGANLLVLPPAFATLLALRRGGVAGLALAAGCAGLAAFTQGNGILVLLAGLVSLSLARRRLEVTVWVLVGLGIVGLSQLGPTTSRATPLVPDVSDPAGVALYALAFLGAPLGLGSGAMAALVGGVLLVAFVALAIRTGSGQPSGQEPWLWGGVAFVLLSVAANAAGRSALGIDYAVAQPRYRIYGALALALLYLLAFAPSASPRARRVAPIALAACVVFSSWSYAAALGPARDLASQAARRVATWSVTGRWPARVPPADAGRVLARSRELGSFAADPAGLARHLDRVQTRDVPQPVAARGQEVRLAADEHFRLLTVRLDPSALGGLAPERLRTFWVLDGERVLGSRRVRGGGTSLRFASVVPRAALPELPDELGLLLDDGSRQLHIGGVARPDGAP